MPRRPNRSLLSLSILLLVLALLGVFTLERQNLVDWWRLRGYQAPATVAALADQDTMTDYGRHLFYVNHPVIEGKQSFYDHCPSGSREEQTIVLGCYHSDTYGIYLLDVTDQRLDGVEQVTAAHEMLHAAYDRLDSGERAKVDAMLQDYYRNGLHDARLQSVMEAYKKSEPNDVVNEMHSVFGTEVVDLPAPLEAYYKKYFANRKAVAAFAAGYQAEFSSRQAAIKADDAQLADLKNRIESLQAELKSQQAAVVSQQAALLRLRDSGDISGYNAGVPAYNSLVDGYNAGVRQLQTLVAQYNQLVASRNALAAEQTELVNELSADVAPINR